MHLERTTFWALDFKNDDIDATKSNEPSAAAKRGVEFILDFQKSIEDHGAAFVRVDGVSAAESWCGGVGVVRN